MTRIMRRLRDAGLFVCFILLASLITAKLELNGEVAIAGPFVAIDGDTLAAGAERLRLQGVDAPEIRQVCRTGNDAEWACGEAARAALEQLVATTAVECRASQRDRYDRLLVRCRSGGRDINAELVRTGMAVASGDYRQDEARARQEKSGLWAGSFDRPRDWRARQGMMDDPGLAGGWMAGFTAWLKTWI